MGGIRFEGPAALGKRCAADRQLESCPVGMPSPLIFDVMSIPHPDSASRGFLNQFPRKFHVISTYGLLTEFR